MSMSGSLMGYENNNEVSHGQGKCKKQGKPVTVVTSVNAAGVTTASNGGIYSHARGNGKIPRSYAASPKPRRRETCARGHLNSLWSLWYGVIAVGFQAYIALRCTKRFIAYLSLPWPADAPPPKIELHACLALAGAGVLLLPILFAAACLKLGNLANDGVKLGRHLSTCSRDPPSSLVSGTSDTGVANNLWRHGGPTAAFVHLCTAMCFLLPSLLMEARLIHAGFLPKDAIWRTDLDWVVVHRDRLVVLSFMNIPENASLSLGGYVAGQQPYLEDELDGVVNGTSETSAGIPYSSSPSSALPAVTDAVSSTLASGETSAASAPNYSFVRNSEISSTGGSASESTTRKPTSRMNARNIQRNRPKARKNSWASGKSKVNNGTNGGTNAGNMSAQSLPLTFNSLADLDHPENLNVDMDETSDDYGPITLEYLNYAMALGVYSVRYPAVFWASNKALGTIFSIQLVANSAQSLLAYAGMSVLYKVQVVGPMKVLPLLRHRTVSTASTISSFFGDRFFLLNPHVTLGIFALSSLLVLCSSMVMYLYAYGRFTAFLNQERERRVIMSKDERAEEAGWTYMTHPAALCLFLAIAICSAPLLYDYTVVYRGSLDGAILACIIGTIGHLGLWLVLWVFLTIKQRWTFKLRVTIGRATVRSARSVKLVTDVDLMSSRDNDDGSPSAPLLVVGNGRTYTVAETSPKKAIMSVIQKAAMERKARSQSGNIDSMDGESTADGDEQIYWLRPKLRPSPVQSGDVANSGPQSNDKGWLNKKLKQKVTFNDLPSTSGARNKGKARRGVADGGPDDDGDYATLRELPLVTAHDLADDSTSEENKVSSGQTPRCLRRADSGMPHEELTPRSDSSHSPPLEAGLQGCVGVGGGPASSASTSSNSETSSSGIHSTASNASSQRRANSVEDLSNEPREEPHWRSCSLQRGTQPPTSASPGVVFGAPAASANPANPGRVIANPMSYAGPGPAALYNGELAPVLGCPAVILENPNEATVVIRRKGPRPKLQEPPALGEEPFGRSTNMRMTSFTEGSDLRAIQASSATLPHYPTQPMVTYPHCSTMPLPHASSSSASSASSMSGSTGSCGSVPRHPGHLGQQSPPVVGALPSHTTLPSHHNGVRLLLHGGPNPFVKRFPPVQVAAGLPGPQQQQQPWALPSLAAGHHHHTFPQAPALNGKLLAPQQVGHARHSDRDSANFSMASSGDSDTCLPH